MNNHASKIVFIVPAPLSAKHAGLASTLPQDSAKVAQTIAIPATQLTATNARLGTIPTEASAPHQPIAIAWSMMEDLPKEVLAWSASQHTSLFSEAAINV